MRDLTAEELALVPEWATHYWIVDEKIMFESLSYFQLLADGVFTDRCHNDAGYITSDAVEVKRKTFDITKHEWSDRMANLAAIMSERGDVVIRVGCSWIFLDRQDGIAIAKALGLTTEDLK